MIFGRKKQEYSLPPSWQDKVVLRHSLRARRLSLTVDLKQQRVVLVLPRRFSHATADHFLLANKGWIESHGKNLVQRLAFAPDAVIPFRGMPHVLKSHERRQSVAEIRDGVIYIGGGVEHFSRRTRDFLIAEARRILTERTQDKAAKLGKKVTAIRLNDPKTRWGSCHPAGRISYSWRLVLAPDHVLDYVVAHEVAHLNHKGHGPDFWACCSTLTDAMAESKNWLKKNGKTLFIHSSN